MSFAAAAPVAFQSTAFWQGATTASTLASTAGTIGSAFAAVQPFMGAFSVATQLLRAPVAMRAGQAQSNMYAIQGLQAAAKANRDALNAELEANRVLDKVRRTNANAVARGYAGGVEGLSGSAKLIQDMNLKYAGRDLRSLDVASRERKTFGQIQQAMFAQAADQALVTGTMNALEAVGSAAWTASQIKMG